jgi:diguanylate cyclase (GGDEF)-like protein
MAAILYLDIDNFKTVNDSMGHRVGDQLLCKVADRLSASVRESDTVSRQGGDEFLILLGQIEGEEAAVLAARKIMGELNLPISLQDFEISVTCSIGIALFPKDGSDASTLLKNSDMAMYRAKDAGRNAFRFFDIEMNSNVVEHFHLAAGIRTALTNEEFRVHYQPQIELATGRIVGAEALIRWRHPSLGFIPPMKFISVAERTGLINDIGAWVLETSCRQVHAWQRLGLDDLIVAVNVSPVQFRRDDIEREIANAIEFSGIKPSCIELELTESLLMADSKHLSGVLDRLRGYGVKFAIDDFGTGYSNLGYLKRFAVQRLKIDQSFVRDMKNNPQNEGIVRAIIQMAICLELEVVAEGVEDAETAKKLTDLGCQFGQGYLWSPALPADEFEALLQTKRARDGVVAWMHDGDGIVKLSAQ